MTHVNKLYGYLTDGDNTERRTTTTRNGLPADALTLLGILIPSDIDDVSKRGLAELYIRLCFTDKALAEDVLKLDVVNSYRLHSFYDTIASTVKLADIVTNIRKSTVPDLENSALPLDYIMAALRHLLRLLKNV